MFTWRVAHQGMFRRIDGLVATLVLVALAIGVVAVQREPERLDGRPRIIDGDTLEIEGRRLRLVGIDAPELTQTCEQGGQAYHCGETAREALREIARAGLACAITGRDKYRRELARCEASGRDVGSVLVQGGMAVAYGRYEAEERHARQRAAGLWAGRFDRPSAWRSEHLR